MPRKLWKIDKFQGGLNDYSDPKDIQSDEFTDIQDVYISRAGSIQPLGQALNASDTVSKVAIGSNVIAGEGACRFKSNHGYAANPGAGESADLPGPTQFTLAQTSFAHDGEYSRAEFTIKSLVWLFTSSANTTPGYEYFQQEDIKLNLSIFFHEH